MTSSLSIERTPAPSRRMSSRFEGIDLAGLTGDGAARAADDGRRRVLASPYLPDGIAPPVCVAAWHAVLHWLSYDDAPAMSCLVGREAHACWPIVTRAGAQTSLAELRLDVEAQWPTPGEAWPDARDPAHAELLDALRCQTIRLEGGPEGHPAPELALIGHDDRWHLACAAARYGEDYQRALLALWHRFVLASIERPHALLADLTSEDEGRSAGIAGPRVEIAGALVQRFEAGMAAAPDKTAVIDDAGHLSYAELHASVDALAQSLHAAGVRRGDYVGLALGRAGARRMVAAQLAVLKTGAAFVPIDAAQPAARLQAIADDTDMRHALCDAASATTLRQALPGVQALPVDAPYSAPAAGFDAAPVDADAPAYVIFTSGSTGKPKGVKVSHGNLLNFVTHMAEFIGADDVVSQFAPFTFDASVAEIHACVLNCGTLAILSGELINDPERLQAYMTEQRVTFAAFPPQYAQHLSPAKLPRLRTLLTAGSAPDHALVARWQPHVRYVNGYGPTETTVLSTAWQPGCVPAAHEPIVIGTPISNTQVRVANRYSRALPPGVIGELLIGGEGVAHGYLKRDALTRERFIRQGDTRWYRSGDLAHLDAEGRLVFAGRVDSQIKLRGHRLEPGEVETALLAVDGMRQAAVTVTGDESSSKQLVAFCVGETVAEDTLRDRLRQLLPAWALPNRFVWIDALPVTRNGKTDYARLVQDLARAQAEAAGDDAEPVAYADALQAQVAEIWRGVLQQPRVRPEDSFIHLGGDSLTALVVTSAVRRLGYALSSAQLLQHPRLADYVALLHAQGRREVANDRARWHGTAPLAPIQGWFFSLGLEQPGRFCQSLVFDSDTRIDPERLARACVRLAAHHDQLRARFVQGAAGWQQQIDADDLVLPVPNVIEIADGLLDPTSDAYGRRLADELRIDAAPLFRLALIHTPCRSRVVWVLHHGLVDTVSHGILLDDLQQLYHHADDADALPGKSLAFAAWSAQLQQRVDADAQALLAPWRATMAEISAAPRLPLVAAPSAGAPVVVQATRVVRETTRRLLEDATRCYRQKPEELVLAATTLALARTFGLSQVAIDIEWHGRDEAVGDAPGVDRTVGWFTSVHPLCIAMPAERTLGAWLMALKEQRAAIPRRGREFYALRYGCRDPEVQAAFAGYRAPEVLFNFSGIVQRSPGAWRTVPVAAIEMGDGNAHPYALSVETELREGELVIACYSRPERWPEGALARLAQALPEALHEIVQHCCDSVPRWTPSDFAPLGLTQAQVDTLPPGCRTAFALTDMQQTMWRHQDSYQVVMGYRMPRRFDADAWQAAVADWVARHDSLRTHVQAWDGAAACQVVLDTLVPPLTIHRAEPGRAPALAEALIDAARRAPVQVEQAPLWHLHAIDDAGDDFLVVLSIHHLIHDGWSIERLLTDLLQGYRQRCGETCTRPAAPLASVADIVALQQRLGVSASWQAYWEGLPWARNACRLPVTAQRNGGAGSPPQGRDMRIHLGAIDPALAAAVRARAAALGVTVNSLWLAGYAALLRSLGGQAQVRCGVIQSGRSEEIPGVETITGCCVNTLPLVLDMPATQTLADTAAAVHAQLLQMRAAAAYPLSAIHAQVKPKLDDELFSTLFNIESHGYGAAADAVQPQLQGGFESTNHEFIFGLIEQPGDDAAAPRYQVRIGYDAELHDAAAVADALALYAHCMDLLVTQADVPWQQLPLLPEPLRARVVEQWNRTDHAYAHERCIHELVAEQAARTPQAPALVCEGRVLSYRELDERANRLAHHLQTLGVGPEQVVGCCFERSVEMVVGLLGVLKAGGAYVPLDPELPAQRLAGMVGDVGIQLVLTQDALARGPLAPLAASVPLLRIDAAAAEIAARPATPPVSRATPTNLAYVIFTSGSTGKPKGAMNDARRAGQPPAMDAARLPARRRRPRAAEDAVFVRRFGVGVLLAADDRRHAGDGAAGRPPRAGVPERADPGRTHHDAALRAVDAAGVRR